MARPCRRCSPAGGISCSDHCPVRRRPGAWKRTGPSSFRLGESSALRHLGAMHTTAGRRGGRTEGHSLVEVLVALLIVVTALLPAGYAVASGIRLGRKGDASAQVALALMARVSLIQQLAGATNPRCLALAADSAAGVALTEWWAPSGTGTIRNVRLRARAHGVGWVVEDSLDVRVQCQ